MTSSFLDSESSVTEEILFEEIEKLDGSTIDSRSRSSKENEEATITNETETETETEEAIGLFEWELWLMKK
jgi:hypothetical protein